MDDELVANENWLKRHWKWLLPMTVLLIFLFLLVITSTSKNDLANIAQTYNENSLFDDAIKIANTNKRVLATIGKIKPLDKLAILEGNTTYTNNNKSIALSVRITGNNGNGKLDISANKKGEVWHYKKISIRIKTPKEEIKVID